MRISRRTSRTTAVPQADTSALRRTTAVGAALALTVLTAAACSDSKSGGASGGATQSQGQVNNANENDIQILNSLQLSSSELNAAFGVDSGWQPWNDYDPAKLLVKQAQACTAGIIDTKAKSLEPVTTAFKADKLRGDTVATAPTTPTATATKSGHPGSTPTPPATTGSAVADANPVHWVVTTAIVYKSSDEAYTAVKNMGRIDDSAPPNTCGGPAEHTPIVGSGIGEVGPSWNNSQGVFVYADTKTNQAVSVVAQRRGRYVVLTYTRGFAQPQVKTGYYDLEGVSDTNKAADAATGVLGQLTDAVVNKG